MSVWPEPEQAQEAALTGTEGELVSATIAVAPELLEKLLDTLAEVQFPINPQIYHNAAVAYIYPDGHETAEPTTIVEFPAYRNRLSGIRELIERRGFPPDSLWWKNLLDDIRSDLSTAPAPPGAPWLMVVRRKHAPRAA